MRELLRALFSAALCLSLTIGCVSAYPGKDDVAGSTVYFLRDDLHERWCGYSSESRFQKQVQSVVARFAGGADFSDDRILMLHISETDESGDWAVYDVYTFDAEGKLHRLERTMYIMGIKEQQFFLIRNGKATKQRQLGPGKAAQKFVNWFKAPPVMVSLEGAPFSVLIGTKRPQVLSNGELCFPIEGHR
jgi:hypothetical protein